MLFGRRRVELNATNNALVRSYVWRLDLSGTMDGAGGVGGLLWLTLHTASGFAAGTRFAAYDGNGNVVALFSASTGTETARYEYGPFGEPIRVTGSAASLNPFCFSTKRTCNAIDLVLYEYRAYSPSLGRWSSRDPLQEDGGNSLCCFAGNDAVDNIDLLGMLVGSVKIDPWQPIKTDKWYNHERGWIFGAIWTPPTGGDWDKPCGCKPCQKVIWIQDVAYGKGSPFQQDWGDSDYGKYGYAWDCTISGSVGAAMYDAPKQYGLIVYLFVSPYSFYARSKAKCVAGPDAGKIYATVLWGFTWKYDGMPAGLGPIIF